MKSVTVCIHFVLFPLRKRLNPFLLPLCFISRYLHKGLITDMPLLLAEEKSGNITSIVRFDILNWWSLPDSIQTVFSLALHARRTFLPYFAFLSSKIFENLIIFRLLECCVFLLSFLLGNVYFGSYHSQ